MSKVVRHPDSVGAVSLTLLASFCPLHSELFQESGVVNEFSISGPFSYPHKPAVGRGEPAAEWNPLLTRGSVLGGVYAKWKTTALSPGLLSQQLLPYSSDGRGRFSYEFEGWKADATLWIQQFVLFNIPRVRIKYYSWEPENLGTENLN